MSNARYRTAALVCRALVLALLGTACGSSSPGGDAGPGPDAAAAPDAGDAADGPPDGGAVDTTAEVGPTDVAPDVAPDAADDAAPDAGGAAGAFPASFRFGVATAAHQVEGTQHNSWTEFETLPLFEGRTREPSGRATDFFHRYAADFDLARDLGMDVFRLSVEWSRVEPRRGAYDAQALTHYRELLLALRERGLEASVTLHHFSEPAWWVGLGGLTDPVEESFCADGPTDEAFCAWLNPDAPQVFGEFCGRVAAELGDLVDEWMTFNEPQAYWMGATVMGDFPPGLSVPLIGASDEDFQRYAVPFLRNILAGHAACYRAIHANDDGDADGDGTAAVVGLATGTGAIRPANPEDPASVDAARQAEWIATFLFFDAVWSGRLDSDFDMVPDEDHPDWAGTLDVLGLQYYAATEVIGLHLLPLLWGVPCLNMDDPFLSQLLLTNGCHAPPTQDFPLGDGPAPTVFGRQHDPEGLLEVLRRLHETYPELPLVITENGFADSEVKRAYSIVRHLEVARQAVAEGIPLTGYYHWSLTDNFEWGRGFAVRFGLYAVDFDGDLERIPTPAATVYGQIARARALPAELLALFGGTGALPETLPAGWDPELPPRQPEATPRFRSLGPGPATAVLPPGLTSCPVLLDERCEGGFVERCLLHDAAGAPVTAADPWTEQVYRFDRYYDRYNRMEGQHATVRHTEAVPRGTPEAEWGRPERFEQYEDYGDGAGWTGTALHAAAARYAVTGTDADYERMLSDLRTMVHLYTFNGIPGLLARSWFAMLEPGAPLPVGHPAKALTEWIEPEDWHFRYPLSEAALAALPAYVTEGVDIAGQHYGVTPVWMGDASVDMYVRSLPGTLLALDLLRDGAEEAQLAAALATELPCTLNRLRRGRIVNLDQNPEVLAALQDYLASGALVTEPGEADLASLTTIEFFVMEQPHPDHMDLFDATCPAGPPLAPLPAYTFDAAQPSFVLDFLGLVGRIGRTSDRPIAWLLAPSVRGSDAAYLTQWALAAHSLTGDERYRDFLAGLIEETPYWDALDRMGSLVLPRWCRSHFAPSLLYPTLWNLMARVDPAVTPKFRDRLALRVTEEVRFKELIDANDPYFAVLYTAMGPDDIDPERRSYAAARLADLAAAPQYPGTDPFEPRRDYPVDLRAEPPAGVVLDEPSEADRAVCEQGGELFGVPIPGPGLSDEHPRAREGLPVPYRILGTFEWEMDPFMVYRTYGAGAGRRMWAARGASIAYWMARWLGLTDAGQGTALAWAATGDACAP